MTKDRGGEVGKDNGRHRGGRSGSAGTRWLSVTAVVVVALTASLVVWHNQVTEFLGVGVADKQPVTAGAGAGAPPSSAPPVRKTRPTPTPTRKTTRKPSPKKTKSPVYDEESIEGLSPKLRGRLRKAIAAAKADGIRITITSARRSEAKQARLLREAIQRYGSYQEATRWVLPPDKSAHVKGKAVDIGPQPAMVWLNKNGWKYGICRRYDNEPWHFEALTTPGTKCPPRESSSAATLKN